MDPMQARLNRAFVHRLYLIQSDLDAWKFVVLGSMSNVYYVSFDQGKCCCTCPDFQNRGNICKHLLFVVYRVLKVPLTYQLCNTIGASIDVDQLKQLACSTSNSSIQAPSSVVDAYTNALQQQKQQVGTTPISTDEDCSICMEVLDKKQENLCSCTKQCDKQFHLKCIEMWKGVCKGAMKCPMCRADFVLPVHSVLNLACSVCQQYQPSVAHTHVDADCDLCTACFVGGLNVDAPRHRNRNCQQV